MLRAWLAITLLAVGLGFSPASAGLVAPGFISAQVSSAAVYTNYNAVDFDGTNDWALRGADLTGNADSTVGLISFWFRMDGLGATSGVIGNTGTKIDVSVTTAGKVRVRLFDVTTALTLVFSTSTGVTTGGWHSYVASWDTNFAAGSKLVKVVVDGVTDAPTITDATIAFTIDYTVADWAIGNLTSTTVPFNGCLAELYFNNVVYLDVTQASNLALFYSAGKPVDLGANGSNVTGAQPIGLWHIGSAGTANDWVTNLGSGGGMTLTGSLDICSDKPRRRRPANDNRRPRRRINLKRAA